MTELVAFLVLAVVIGIQQWRLDRMARRIWLLDRRICINELLIDDINDD